jgi:hypothetical protein
MEWSDSSGGTIFFIRGISTTLDGAIGLTAQHKLAGPGANDQTDIEFNESCWQIEEVPMDVMLRNDIPANDEYANAGAVAMYDIDGTLVRKLSDE